ncbi:integumentary mucin C.1-like [Mya arenaria]|uniref:integumentary mucin C.1-like n=1 Tax=Mya arenaria TaxID=6604 RepID=UPI0022E91329|nr:integumentary mucin C.1-like [Mya arenaria]
MWKCYLQVYWMFMAYIQVGGLELACSMGSDVQPCPPDHCCVRDEFIIQDTHCAPLLTSGSRCSTKPSDNECPCIPGYRCANNANGDVTSVFGKCYPNVTITTIKTTTSTTTTTATTITSTFPTKMPTTTTPTPTTSTTTAPIVTSTSISSITTTDIGAASPSQSPSTTSQTDSPLTTVLSTHQANHATGNDRTSTPAPINVDPVG